MTVRRRAIIITGPTASGKSALAIKAAHALDGVVINADSMQLYREAPILTAQPSEGERADVPHYGYGICDASQRYSVAEWSKLTARVIDDNLASGRVPIIVGGTGLYVQALMQGLSAIPDIDADIRAEIRAMDASSSYHALYTRDPAMAKRLQAGDGQRVARALEVLTSTGRSLAWWQEQPLVKPLDDVDYQLYGVSWPRAQLYSRINDRAALLFEQGAGEARYIAQHIDAHAQLCKAVGVAEMLRYVSHAWDAATTREKMQQNTRNYAKRQLTWIRNQYHDITMVDGDDYNMALATLISAINS